MCPTSFDLGREIPYNRAVSGRRGRRCEGRGPALRDFGYDHLDRLTGAWTTGGGQGAYDRTYEYDQIGNITEKSDVGSYTYGDTNHVHAVTSAGDNSYVYDANGNQTTRMVVSGTETITYTQEFNVNNKLEVVTGTNGITETVTTFTYDGDGNRVKKVEGEVTTYYVGSIYELQGTRETSYYYVAGQRVAMRVTEGATSTLTYLHGDHLGSTSLATSEAGAELYRRGYSSHSGSPPLNALPSSASPLSPTPPYSRLPQPSTS